MARRPVAAFFCQPSWALWGGQSKQCQSQSQCQVTHQVNRHGTWMYLVHAVWCWLLIGTVRYCTLVSTVSNSLKIDERNEEVGKLMRLRMFTKMRWIRPPCSPRCIVGDFRANLASCGLPFRIRTKPSVERPKLGCHESWAQNSTKIKTSGL